VVGIEFQGLTGVAAISLVGGAPSAPPVPLDADGVPVLNADLREQQESVVDTLHRVDNFLVENRESIKDTMLSAESYTASLKSKADAIESILGKADSAFAGFDSGMDRITNALPGFADGKAEELFEKMKSLRELADTYKKKADTFMDDGRRMLSDLSESANNMTRKIDPSALSPPAPPRRPQQKRQ
jgi:phospholipid/cholesterol/gamma-HCH transport system substrate-binding protein